MVYTMYVIYRYLIAMEVYQYRMTYHRYFYDFMWSAELYLALLTLKFNSWAVELT